MLHLVTSVSAPPLVLHKHSNIANSVLFVLSDATAKKTCSQLRPLVLSGSVAFAITSTLLTKGFWHLVLSRMLAQILKQVGSSQMSHWITLSWENLKKLHCGVQWRMTYVVPFCYRIHRVIDESFARCTSVYFYADSYLFYFFSVIFLNVRSRECRAVLTGHQIMQTALTVESAECR